MLKQAGGKHRAGAKVGAMSTSALDQSVDQAEETYHAFVAKLRSLISTLKSHHEAMLELNRTQVEATTAICDFLVNTPLSTCASATDPRSQTKKETIHKADKGNDTVTDTTDKDKSDSEQLKTGLPKQAKEGIGRKESFQSAGIDHSFDNVVADAKNLDELGESFTRMCGASNDLNNIYAKKYMDWIIRYLEELDKIISTRVEGKLFQFRELQHKYAHYTDKVQGLTQQVDKQSASRASGARPRLENKLNRNRVKLSGTGEAHYDLGKSLLSLIDEVTTHYWKDLVPLLHMTIQYNMNHATDLAAVMAKMAKTDTFLRNVCEQEGVSITGRLDKLKPEKVQEIRREDEPPHEGSLDVSKEGKPQDEEVRTSEGSHDQASC